METTAWQDEMSGTLNELREASQPDNVFIWKGKEVPVTSSAHRRASELVEGGFEINVDVRLRVLLSAFITMDSTLLTMDSELWTMDSDQPRPVAGKTLQYKGREYRIAWTEVGASGTWVDLGCDDVNK